ncbi:hypothetical protein [Streptomyces sp. NPDC057552]|uniref:hypothetical protein n=1 Tax=Streptomyces sp. NPDC057552 TaxID=3350537 RepID=UPI0036863416
MITPTPSSDREGRHTVCTDNTVRDSSVGISVQAGSITGLTISPATAMAAPPPPCQLPTPPAPWVDRDTDLTLLLRQATLQQPGVRVIAVHGPAGSGTTALAVRLLHELRELGTLHPGGQLYVDMRGGEPTGALPAGRALGQLLRSVHPGPLPVDARERASWWRSVTAGRAPLCLLLDNAVHAADVRACLPAGSGHLVLVTSRLPLVELDTDGAYHHQVGPLPPPAAHQYLALRAGTERLRAEPQAAGHLIHLAGGLPAALSLTAAQLSLHPQRPLSALVQALAVYRPGPDRPHHPGVIMTTHFDVAYAGLERDTARTYRQLSRLPVRDIDTSLAAAVRTITPEAAAGHLTALAAAGLLENPLASELRGPLYRFASPELQDRALQLARDHETDGEDHDVQGRALGWALAAATAADALATASHHRTLSINPGDLPHTPQHPVHHQDADAALAWLTDQSENLLALVRAASRAGRDEYVWRLVYSMWPWWRAAGHHDEWIEVHGLALAAASRDPRAGELAQRHLMNTFGLGLRNANDPIALHTFTRVREMAREAGDAAGEAQALYEVGATHLHNDNADQAVPLLEQARHIRAEHGYQRGVALTDILLGRAVLRLTPDDPGQALRRFRQARAVLVGTDAHDAARALAWQGRTEILAGEAAAGEASLEAAVQEFLDAHAPGQAARALEWLGDAAQGGDRCAEARAFYNQALSLYLPVDAAAADRIRDHLARLNS